jgi:hypothetical protein
VLDVLGIGKIGGGYGISVGNIRGGPRAGMAGLGRGRNLEIEGHCNVGERGRGIFDRIRNELRAGRNSYLDRTREGERLIGRGIDRRRNRVQRPGNVNRGEVQRLGTERIRDVDA